MARQLRVLAVLALLAPIFAARCDHKTPVEPTPDCTVTVAPVTLSFEAAGGTAAVQIATGSGCAWTAASSAGWFTIGGPPAGSGPASIAVTAVANGDETDRNGTLTISGKTVSITQKGKAPAPPPNCTYAISPELAGVPREGAAGSVTVTAPAGCSWAAASNVPWITIVSGSPGSGSGAVSYAVAANGDTAGRTGTITVADRVLTVSQDGNTSVCTYSVGPVEFAPCMEATELVATMTTQASCPWTAVPNASWISVLSGASGNGSGLIRWSVTSNYDLPRLGLVMVRWPTITAGQNLRVAQAGCHYFIAQTAFSPPAAGGAFTFDVVQESDPNTCGGPRQDRCVWSAVSDSPWIVVTSSMPRTGDDRVAFAVQANPNTASRAGTIAVHDQIVHVSQAGR